MNENKSYTGKVAFVTGAGSGEFFANVGYGRSQAATL